MRKSHLDFIERWALYVKHNKDWKVEHTAFINSQYEKVVLFYDRLAKEPHGVAKIAKLRER